MQFEGAVIREQGVTFAIVIVKKYVVDNVIEARKTIRSFMPVFPGVPIVLMGQDSAGGATFFGRRDITNFLANISLNRIPWKRYTI